VPWHIPWAQKHFRRLEAATRSRRTRPTLKSLCTSIAFPAFLLGHDPTQRVINVSYSQELGAKFTAGFRQVVKSEWYRRIFPATRAARDAEGEFETTCGGGRVSISIGGSMTGRGGNFIVIDDPLKAEEALSRSARERVNDYYGTTLLTRLDSKIDGVIVLVMQRLHAEDLAGRLINEGGWTHLNLPAIAPHDERTPLTGGRWHSRKEGEVLHPEREPRAILEELRRALGSMHFQAQYQQAPVSEIGNIIKLPFPDGTIIARLAWNYNPSEENNKVFGRPQSFVAGSPKNGVQFMVKDSTKYASTGSWGFAQFDDGKPANEAVHNTCFSCHEPAKARDLVFTRYAP
jgi:hypothetical protein